MAEILLMKTIKILISWYCYIGTSFVAIDQLPNVDITKALNIPPAMQYIIIYLLIIFWIVKITWFVYEKFYLESKERRLGISKSKKELNEKGERHLS